MIWVLLIFLSGTVQDSIYFDNILDITLDLPIPPNVNITVENITQIEDNDNGRLVQTYQFYAEVDDSDSQFEQLNFYWIIIIFFL